MQVVTNQINHYKISYINNAVFKAAQKARTEGYFTEDIINDLRDSITQAFPRINPGDIGINVTTTPKYRTDKFIKSEMISYEISVPIDKILVMNNFFGISDSENRMQYIVKGEVPSERLLP